jgi:hypothetical protein
MIEPELAEASPAEIDVDEHQARDATASDRRPPSTSRAFEQTSLFELEPDPAAVMAELPVDELPSGELRDPAQMAFSVVGRGAAIRLRSSFEGRRLWAAETIYGALTELASDAAAGGRGSTAEFRATRKDVAVRAGVKSVRTVDFYCDEFERIGLLEVVSPRGGRAHRGNLWRLLQVSGDARGAAPRAPSESGGAPDRASNHARGAAPRAPDLKKKEQQEGNVIPLRDRRSRTAPGRDFSRFDKAMRR